MTRPWLSLAVVVLACVGCREKPKPAHLPTDERSIDILRDEKSWKDDFNLRNPPAKPFVEDIKPVSHEAQVYAELWKVCKARHLKYQVTCWPDLGCTAWAWPYNKEFDHVPMWDGHAEIADSTKATERLIEALKGEPNDLPSSPEKVDEPSFDTGEIRP